MLRACASILASPGAARWAPALQEYRRCTPRIASGHLHSRQQSRTAAMQSKDELFSTPGVCRSRDSATNGFIFQQTMFRIKDPKRTLDFYTRVMGMTLLTKLDFEPMEFSLLFLGMVDPASVPEDPKDRGSENDPKFKVHSGNEDPKGFGHIGFAVPDVESACKRFEELGVEFVKRPSDGKMKGIAFIKDPDGYWIEILNAKASRDFVGWKG